MINYFISYHFTSRFGNGFGRCCIQREISQPIVDINDISSIEKTLKAKNNFDEITIVNWKRFEDDN